MQEFNEMFHQGYITPFVQEFEKLKENKEKYESSQSLFNNSFSKEKSIFKQRKGFYKLSNTLLYANLSMNALFVYIHLCKFTERVSINDLYLRKYLKSKYNQNLSALALKKAKDELIAKNLLQIIKTNYHRINYEWILRNENKQIIKHFNKDKIQNYLLAKNETKSKNKNDTCDKSKLILKNQNNPLHFSQNTLTKTSQEKTSTKLDFSVFKDNAKTKLKNDPQNENEELKYSPFSAHAKIDAEKQNRYYIETHARAFPIEQNLIKFKNIIKLSQERKEEEREQENCFSCQSHTQSQTNIFQNTAKKQNLNQKDKKMNPKLLENIKPTPPNKEILFEWLKEYNSIHKSELNYYEITKFLNYYHLKEYKSKNGEYIQNFKNAFFGWLNRAILFQTQNKRTQNSYFTNEYDLNAQNAPLNHFYENNNVKNQKTNSNDLRTSFEAINNNFQNTQVLENTALYEAEEDDFYQEQIPTEYGNPRDFMMNDELSSEEKERLLTQWKAKNPTHTEEYRQKAFQKTLYTIYQRRIAKGDILL